jgi:hypothetical protein
VFRCEFVLSSRQSTYPVQTRGSDVKGGTRVSSTAKVVYFIAALLVMTCFAVGSVMMAEDQPKVAAVLFIAAIVGAGAGFATKRKVMKR